MNDEVDFLHAGKHENLLQIDTMILMEMVKHFRSSQNSKFTMSAQYLKKEVFKSLQYFKKVRNGVYFLHSDKHQRF